MNFQEIYLPRIRWDRISPLYRYTLTLVIFFTSIMIFDEWVVPKLSAEDSAITSEANLGNGHLLSPEEFLYLFTLMNNSPESISGYLARTQEQHISYLTQDDIFQANFFVKPHQFGVDNMPTAGITFFNNKILYGVPYFTADGEPCCFTPYDPDGKPEIPNPPPYPNSVIGTGKYVDELPATASASDAEYRVSLHPTEFLPTPDQLAELNLIFNMNYPPKTKMKYEVVVQEDPTGKKDQSIFQYFLHFADQDNKQSVGYISVEIYNYPVDLTQNLSITYGHFSHDRGGEVKLERGTPRYTLAQHVLRYFTDTDFLPNPGQDF